MLKAKRAICPRRCLLCALNELYCHTASCRRQHPLLRRILIPLKDQNYVALFWPFNKVAIKWCLSIHGQLNPRLVRRMVYLWKESLNIVFGINFQVYNLVSITTMFLNLIPTHSKVYLTQFIVIKFVIAVPQVSNFAGNSV